MKLGLSSYTYTWACGLPGHPPLLPMTAVDLARSAADLGVGVIQCCENLPLRRGDIAGIKALGVEIEVGTRGLLGPHLADAFDLAAACDSRFVRLVIDRDEHEPSPDEAIALLRPWADQAAATGIKLAIENHDRFPAASLVEVVEALGSDHVGITLDTVNSFGALEGPEVVVRTLAPYVLSLHLKDFTIRRVPSQMGFVIDGCPAGQGRLDIPWLLSELRLAGRDPNAIVELWTPPAATLEETIAREAAWAIQSVSFLRTLIPE